MHFGHKYQKESWIDYVPFVFHCIRETSVAAESRADKKYRELFGKLFPIILKKGLFGSYGALIMLEHIFGDDDYMGRTFEPNKELSDKFKEMREDIYQLKK